MTIFEILFFVFVGFIFGVVIATLLWLDIMVFAVKKGYMKIKKDGKWVELSGKTKHTGL